MQNSDVYPDGYGGIVFETNDMIVRTEFELLLHVRLELILVISVLADQRAYQWSVESIGCCSDNR